MKNNSNTKIFIRKGCNILSVFLCSLFSLFSYAQIYTTGDAILYVSQDATITQNPITPTKLFVASGATVVGEEYTNVDIVTLSKPILPIEHKAPVADKQPKKNVSTSLTKAKKVIPYKHFVFCKNNTKQVFAKSSRNICVAATPTYRNKHIGSYTILQNILNYEFLYIKTVPYFPVKKIDNLSSSRYNIRPPPTLG